MKNTALNTILTIMAVSLIAITIFIMRAPGIPKPLMLGLFVAATIFTALVFITKRNIASIPSYDRNEKVLDIIFSTFELHAQKLPEEDEIEMAEYFAKRNDHDIEKKKVDSFEIHL